jgi:hypothetical protein
MLYYADPPEGSGLLQGDVLRDIPVITLPESLLIYRNGKSTSPENDFLNKYTSGPESVVVNSYKTNVLIISHTCDIQRREFISFVPVFPLHRISNPSHKKLLKEKKIKYYIGSIYPPMVKLLKNPMRS